MCLNIGGYCEIKWHMQMKIMMAVSYLLLFWKILEPSGCSGEPFSFGTRVSIWEASTETLF